MESRHSPVIFDVEIDDSAHGNQVLRNYKKKDFSWKEDLKMIGFLF